MAPDRKIALLLLGIAGGFYANLLRYPAEAVAFPKFFSLALLGLSVLLFFFPQTLSNYHFKLLFAKEKLLAIGFLIGYVVLFPILGFFVTTLLYGVVYLTFFDKRNWKKHFLIITAYGVVFYFVFQKWLLVWFPKGWLI